MRPEKKIMLLITLFCIMNPINAIPENLHVENYRNCYIINGKRIDTTESFQRIYDRARKYRSHHDAVEFAGALSDKELWKELAAICEIESEFNSKAVGKIDKDDRGAFQINRRYHAGPDADKQPISTQADRADRILRDLLSSNNKRMFQAVRRYNGNTEVATVYAERVMKLKKTI